MVRLTQEDIEFLIKGMVNYGGLNNEVEAEKIFNNYMKFHLTKEELERANENPEMYFRALKDEVDTLRDE